MSHPRTHPILGALVALTFTLPVGAQAAQQDSENVTNGELAIALLRAVEGSSFAPTACAAGPRMFTDVPASNPFCPWIEELARRGITEGCTATEYCPGSPVTRAQMAVFVMRGIEAAVAQVPQGPPGPQGPQGPEGPQGPPGFAGDCNAGLAPDDEMVRAGSVCVDKYEASIWDAPVGGNQITCEIPCAANGQDCDNIWARSVAGVQPRFNITWFQAQAALANSGKRLPTNAEWQMAVLGTQDPGNLPGTEDCNTNSSGPELGGERANCVSRWGAHDMVGNLLEWVADWVPASTTCTSWGGFSDDWMCLSGASTTDLGPGALLRGGDLSSGTIAGPLAVNGGNRPSSSFPGVGFRGAR